MKETIGFMPGLLDSLAASVDEATEMEALLTAAVPGSLPSAQLQEIVRLYGPHTTELDRNQRRRVRWERDHPHAPGLDDYARLVDEQRQRHERIADLVTSRHGVEIAAAAPVPGALAADTADDAKQVRLAELAFDLIAGYADARPDQVREAAAQIYAARAADEVLVEVIRFTAFVAAHARTTEAALAPRAEARANVLSLLAATVPPHEEIAAVAAIDGLREGDVQSALEILVAGPGGATLAAHTFAAHTAVLAAEVCVPGGFTTSGLTVAGDEVFARV